MVDTRTTKSTESCWYPPSPKRTTPIIQHTDENSIEENHEEAGWLTGALHRAVESIASLDYCFHRSRGTDEWLLLRGNPFGEYPEVIAVYPRDEDIYQMFHLAVTILGADIARRANRIGYDGDPSVYRHGL